MDAVAHAIADPVRRTIVAMLRDADLTAGQIAERFDISRPAISRHLRVLREAGLAVDEPVGRRRVYRLDPDPLAEVEDWIVSMRAESRRSWDQHLDALDTEVHRATRDRERTTQARKRATTNAFEEAG